MNELIEFCARFTTLTDEATEDLLNVVKKKTVSKGDALLKSGDTCKNIYFINEGLCKTLFYKEHKKFIMHFFAEQEMFTVLDSFLPQTPSIYEVMALEQTTYTYLLFTDLEKLCKKHHCMETFFRKLVSTAAIKMMKRISDMLEDNASERYADFLKDYPQLLQRISLGDLANFLGITQVSLSRIRASK